MHKGRMEAFTDGVIAVIITIMVLVLGIASAFFAPILSCVIYAVVAVLWFVPDRRFERVVAG